MKREYNKYRNYDDWEENEYDDKNPLSSDSKKKIFLIIGIIIAIIIVSVGGFFGYKKMQVSSLEKKAESFVEVEDYTEAIKIYSELYTKTGNVDYKTKSNQLKIKKEIFDLMEEAKKEEQKGEYVKAISLYKQVPQEDEEASSKAKSKIESLKSEALKQASSLIDAGNTSSASTLLSEYLQSVPDDKKGLELMKKVTGKEEAEVKKQVIITGSSSSNSSSSNIGAAYNVAKSITGTTQTIYSSEANIRTAPSKSAAVAGTVRRGDSVFVYDTYVESASRIWCQIDSGWISYNTINGTIR